MDYSTCFLCKLPLLPNDVVSIKTKKEKSELKKISEWRADKKFSSLDLEIELHDIVLHKRCRNLYTEKECITAAEKYPQESGYILNSQMQEIKIERNILNLISNESTSGDTLLNLERQTVHEEKDRFDYENLCIICGTDASARYIRNDLKKPLKARKPVSCIKKPATARRLIDLSYTSDEKYREVRNRVRDQDLVALRARYHCECYHRFRYIKRGRCRGRPPKASKHVQVMVEDLPECWDEYYKDYISQTKTRRKAKNNIESKWFRRLCNTCLSNNRQLYRLVQYTYILSAICGESKRKRTYVCWECLGILRKIKNFKNKVEKAQETLNEIKLQKELNLPNNLSNLAEIKLCNVDYYGHIENASSFPRIEVESYGKRHFMDTEIESKHVVDHQLFINPEISNIENHDFEEKSFDNNIESDFEIDQNNDFKATDIDSSQKSRRLSQKRKCTKSNHKVQKTRKRPVKHKNTDKTTDTDSNFEPAKKKHQKDCNPENKPKEKKIVQQPRRKIIQRCKITYEKSNLGLVVRKMKIQAKDVDVWMKRERNSEFFRNLKNKCELCVSKLQPNESLQEHLETLHKKTPTGHVCPICKIVFKSLDKLRNHLEHHNFVLRCGLCGFLCYSKHNMLDHLGRHRRTIECSECGAQFQFSKDFDAHYKLNHSSFQCDKCRKKFTTKERLLKHIDSNHTSKMCSECNKSFVNSLKLSAHKKYKHVIDRSEHNFCVACNVQYNNQSQFKSHLYTSLHHAAERNKPPKAKVRVKCEVCANTFSTRDAMLRHHKKFHLRMKGYCCHLCDKDFRASNVLRDHIKYVHEGVPRPRNHICHICARGFNVRKTLVHHVLTHTGERPHQCPHCDARFAQRTAMRTHIRNRHR